MRQADIQELQDRASDLVKHSHFGKRVRSVTVEANETEETGEYLRVVVELEDVDALPLEEMDQLVRAIEDAIAPIDDRFPSVRFADAA